MRLLGSMEPWLASTFLPLLLLTWLPVGTASQMLKPVSTVHIEIGLENLTVQVKWYNSECLEKENQTNTVILGENCMNFTSSSLCTAHTGICVSGVFFTTPNSTNAGNQTNTVFVGENCRNFTNSSLCTACTGICVCGVFITRPNSTDTGDSTQAAYLSKWQWVCFHGGEEWAEQDTASSTPLVLPCFASSQSILRTGGANPAQQLLADSSHHGMGRWSWGGQTMGCWFFPRTCHILQLQHISQPLTWLELWWQEGDSQDCWVKSPAPKQSRVQGVLCLWTVFHSCFCLSGCGCAGPQTGVTGKIWTGLNLLLCTLLGLAVGTLLYMPVIAFLLWQRRRDRTGELMSGEVTEGNQASTAAPVTGTEDLTYANLNFEKKGTGSASSNVIYTEIKPLQQKQSRGDGSAACTEVDVSPKAEGK
ncbi:uncharacterized protein LOC120507914 isoform X1 [Passer montanus]|uniref:uncharacterized protein LOC120507914 isoform X1 n=1 Tax=Passer montanus TaxID=9160 RepID=UPI001960E108|nr:uncharacterized protein LOC120507914 isoform X1 [Passer montanus]